MILQLRPTAVKALGKWRVYWEWESLFPFEYKPC